MSKWMIAALLLPFIAVPCGLAPPLYLLFCSYFCSDQHIFRFILSVMKSLLINPSFPFAFVKFLLLEDKLAMALLLASVRSLNCYYHVITVGLWVRKRLDVTSFPVVPEFMLLVRR